jgi:hypothetical protein
MANFPTLKTGAVAQYPLAVNTSYSTQFVRFLDGSQQTFRLYPAGLRRWTVQLDGLDEQELDSFISFAEAQGGDPFTFTDPGTGVAVPNCIISGQQVDAGMAAEMTGQTQVVIEEIA